MRTEVIKADSIDAAAELILGQLTEGSRSRENVIYFDGWDGLGASAVLRSMAQRPAVSLQFDQVIHVDCSKWESWRALQRVIAEQLELPTDVMDMLNQQDEEDDFNGVAQGSRDEVQQVRDAMYERIRKLNHRFLVIFHNGSGEEIDLASFCGFPLFGYSRNRVLWTFQGRFRFMPRSKVDTAVRRVGWTDVVLSATHHERDPQELWSDLVHQEAADLVVAARLGHHQPSQVAECFFYMWKLCGMVHGFRTDYDLAIHGCNYWICDGIILGADNDGAWRSAHALQQEMRLDVDYHSHNLHQRLPSHLERCAESVASLPHWTSPTFPCSYTGTVMSFPVGDYIHKLGVLKLSHCIFSFSSPPFRRCQNLRFLRLDQCKDDKEEISSADEAGTTEECFFRRLWVLDLRYTCCDRILSAEMMDLMTKLRELHVMGAQDWDMGQLQGRLPNIRKLRVTKSTIKCTSSCSSENGDLFWGMMDKMEHLQFSGNRITSGTKSITMAANNSLLGTVIIDEGCSGLEQISFRGCAQLKIVLLSGSFENLESIDISGTAVKTLDLSAVVAKKLDKLLSLGCDKLCAVLWPPQGNMKKYPSNLRIETTVEARSTSATSGSSSLSVKYGSRAPTEYNWYVSVSDARLLRSLIALKAYFHRYLVHMEISSPGHSTAADVGEQLVLLANAQKGQPVIDNASVYEGVAAVTLKLQQASEGNDGDAPTTITQIWPCPKAPKLGTKYCYMYIQDHHQPMRSKLLLQLGEKAAASSEGIISTSSGSITVPDMICYRASILHVHDSKSITCVPGPLQGSTWSYLNWCRVERCPRLDCVFFIGPQVNDQSIFWCPETLWSSQLPKVRCIWNLGTPSSVLRFHPESFEYLSFVHVDLCPRLTHVLPLSTTMIREGWCLRGLETLEIVWCGDLRAVFPITSDNDDGQSSQDQQQQQQTTTATVVEFPNLKRIHLHELPMLHGICGSVRMYAPKLESVKIRGCWSLTHLPAVDGVVECDCEKEWWDKLKWKGKDVNHAPSLYKPTHPRYYKRRLLRSSVLR